MPTNKIKFGSIILKVPTHLVYKDPYKYPPDKQILVPSFTKSKKINSKYGNDAIQIIPDDDVLQPHFEHQGVIEEYYTTAEKKFMEQEQKLKEAREEKERERKQKQKEKEAEKERIKKEKASQNPPKRSKSERQKQKDAEKEAEKLRKKKEKDAEKERERKQKEKEKDAEIKRKWEEKQEKENDGKKMKKEQKEQKEKEQKEQKEKAEKKYWSDFFNGQFEKFFDKMEKEMEEEKEDEEQQQEEEEEEEEEEDLEPHFNTLGLTSDASMADVKKAYRRLVLKHHPDKNGGDSETIKHINHAYETIIGKGGQLVNWSTCRPFFWSLKVVNWSTGQLVNMSTIFLVNWSTESGQLVNWSTCRPFFWSTGQHWSTYRPTKWSTGQQKWRFVKTIFFQVIHDSQSLHVISILLLQ
eukprot:gene8703-11760_t